MNSYQVLDNIDCTRPGNFLEKLDGNTQCENVKYWRCRIYEQNYTPYKDVGVDGAVVVPKTRPGVLVHIRDLTFLYSGDLNSISPDGSEHIRPNVITVGRYLWTSSLTSTLEHSALFCTFRKLEWVRVVISEIESNCTNTFQLTKHYLNW